MYHERQRLSRCAVHALNNFFQRPEVTVQELESIAHSLCPSVLFNPHKSIFQWGNYDVNVIGIALERRGYQIDWFDQRRSLRDLPTDVEAFLINFKCWSSYIPFKRTRHWVCVLNMDGAYIDMDSKLDEPRELRFGDFIHYLQSLEDLQVLEITPCTSKS
ncbi:hypothetical protein P9112_003896 [Eukaryota sp. TZLM1-RC]